MIDTNRLSYPIAASLDGKGKMIHLRGGAFLNALKGARNGKRWIFVQYKHPIYGKFTFFLPVAVLWAMFGFLEEEKPMSIKLQKWQKEKLYKSFPEMVKKSE